MPLRLHILNLLRWLREHALIWLLLSSIYSLTAAILLQSIFENLSQVDISLRQIWVATILILFIPAALERISIPLPQALSRFFSFMTHGFTGSFTQIYLKHDLRRMATILTVLFSLLIGCLLPDKKQALWILAAQLPMQRALFSVHRWRTLAIGHFPETGAEKLINALFVSQTVQLLIASIGLAFNPNISTQQWIFTLIGAWGGILSASAMSMEGDSGRPWLVNFIALAAGTLGGFLCFYSPWFLLLVIYFGWNMKKRVQQRLHSVEHLDEDSLL